MALKYQRILLKISGEALGGEKGMGFDEPTMDAICGGVKKAATLCRDNKLPILVFDLADPDNIAKAVQGENVGTLVYEG